MARADFDRAMRVDTQAGGALDEVLKAFRRREIVREARWARLQRLHLRCRKASERVAELKVEASRIEWVKGDAGATSAPERAVDEMWERGQALGTQGVGRRRHRRRHR